LLDSSANLKRYKAKVGWQMVQNTCFRLVAGSGGSSPADSW